MNPEQKALEQQLESATAREVPPSVPLDPETASLREGWLAFGQLLAAAEPSPERAIALLRKPPASRNRWWLLAAVGAMAASLLAAMTIVSSGGRSESAVVLNPTPVEGSGTPAKKPAVADKTTPAKKPSLPAASTSAPAWDDALDKEITVAGEAVVSASQDWTHFTSAGATLSYGLEQVEKDIKESPL
jgi:hypothetical protein